MKTELLRTRVALVVALEHAGDVRNAATVALRASVRLIDAVLEHDSGSLHAEALRVANDALRAYYSTAAKHYGIPL